MKTPKAFLSYSWDDEDHKDWVAALATQLRGDGVETILDRWHAVPGDQLPHFMEREIRQNDYVVIVCTPKYRKKSDERSGGVGYEGDIMTSEVHTQGNHRKFIPVLARGEWLESAPSWLRGKYFVDLRDSPNAEKHYRDLLNTILGTREQAPPVTQSAALTPAQPRRTTLLRSSPTEPVQITGVIVDEVTEPRLDGTKGSALYRVPFRLSRKPSAAWQQLFLQAWKFPPQFTSMHRFGIASVSGDKIVLDGTTIEEVEKYHRDTLILCVSKANEEERQLLEQRQRELGQQQLRSTGHRSTVNDVANRLKFG